jgi:predicted transcriptional regulator
MTTLDLIRQLSKDKNISLAELAHRIGQSPQNFHQKLKHETLTIKELDKVAKELGWITNK